MTIRILLPVHPWDLCLVAMTASNVAHLLVYDRQRGQWQGAAACGAAGWTQQQLDAQLIYPPRLEGLPRCGTAHCAQLWSVYDLRRLIPPPRD